MQNIGGLGALCPVTHWVIYPWYRRGAWARPRAENPTCTEESGMSNIQLNFTFNRLTTSPPVPLHTSSLRSCSKFAETFLISISILAVNRAMLWHMFHQLAPSENWLSSLREEVCDLWDGPGPGGKSARGECDADIFAKCHECHDSWLGHFHTKSSLYTVYTKLNTALAQLITSPKPWPFLRA